MSEYIIVNIEGFDKKLRFPKGTDRAVIQRVVNEQIAAKKKRLAEESRQKHIEDAKSGNWFGNAINTAAAFGQGLILGLGDEFAGLAGATMGTIHNALDSDSPLQGQSFGEMYRGVRDTSRDRLESFKSTNPIQATVAETIGSAATGLAGIGRKIGADAIQHGLKTAANRAGIKNTVGRASAEGAAFGGLYGIGNTDSEGMASVGDMAANAGKNALVGGAFGGALPLAGQGISRLSSKAVSKNTNPDRLASMELLESKGIPLTAAQRTDSPGLRGLDAAMSKTVITGRMIDDVKEAQVRKSQGELMSMAGFAPADVAEGLVTAPSLKRAKENLSAQYDNLLENEAVTLPKDLVDETFNAGYEMMRNPVFTKTDRKRAKELFKNYAAEFSKPLSGKRFHELRRDVSAQITKAAKGDNRDVVVEKAFTQIKNDMESLFSAGAANPNFAQQYRNLNLTYANFKSLEKGVSGGGGSPTNGYVNMASVQKASKGGKLAASQEFKDLVGAHQHILPSSVPNSGTPSGLLNFLELGGIGAGTAAGIMSEDASLGGGGMLAALGLLGGRAGQRALAKGNPLNPGHNAVGWGIPLTGQLGNSFYNSLE